jgi:hypothetical protein
MIPLSSSPIRSVRIGIRSALLAAFGLVVTLMLAFLALSIWDNQRQARKGPRSDKRGHQLGAKSISIGGPSRTRTLDPLIKSCREPRTQDIQADLSLGEARNPD